MWATIKTFLSANALQFAGILLAALSAFAVLFGARQAGKNAERAANLERQSKMVKKANEVRNENRRNYSAGGAAQRLRDKW